MAPLTTETSTRRPSDGRVTPHYDPAMVMQFTHHADDYRRWDEWDTLDIPRAVPAGEASDLLLPETAEAMRNRGPRAVVVEIAGCGHAPGAQHAGTVRAGGEVLRRLSYSSR